MKRTHGIDHYDPDGCFGCRVQGVMFSADAMPSRAPDAVFHKQREKEWDRDHAAVRTLAKQGVTPAHCDGAADLANRATSKEQIEAGSLTI